MVTKTATKAAPKKMVVPKKKASGVTTAVKEAGARERGPRDYSPKWDVPTDWEGNKFTGHFRAAMRYYNLNHSGKDLKHNVIEWMSRMRLLRLKLQHTRKLKIGAQV